GLHRGEPAPHLRRPRAAAQRKRRRSAPPCLRQLSGGSARRTSACLTIMGLLGLFDDYTLRVVALGAGLLGAVSGGLGSLAVLRRQSLLGDAISHAALPGIVLAYLLTGSRSTLVLVLGAAVAGWI